LCDAETYFSTHAPSRYMLMNEVVRGEWRDKLSSITHHDNTCRLQVLQAREDNVHLWDLLTELKTLGAIPVILNTSYNISRKPLVNSTAEALSVLANSEMYGTVVGDCFFQKAVSA
jgi:predicted NodU family carbamoyl transferase